MAKIKERQGVIGTWVKEGKKDSAPFASLFGTGNDTPEERGTYQGSLLDFEDVKYNGKMWKGTYNPSYGGGATDQTLLQDAKVGLGNSGALSLGSSQNLVDKNKNNPFFSEFFNYYLGIAQERQANLSKTLTRKDMLSGSSAASQLGGTLL